MPSQSNTLFKASLITLCFMILGMVLIGGLTRLTGSGLSIVEWKPVTGFIPPLTSEDWLMEFRKYQASPEFQKINFGMTLDEFKSIFYLEYIHRLWGRLIGFVLLIPTFLMIFKRQHQNLGPLLGILWGLGLAQGLMGWLMVKSGLSSDPHVSAYRLSAHLALGFMIFGVALWMTFKLFQEKLMRVCLKFRLNEDMTLFNPSTSVLRTYAQDERRRGNSLNNINELTSLSAHASSVSALSPELVEGTPISAHPERSCIAAKSKDQAALYSTPQNTFLILRRGSLLALIFVFLTALFGALVAGLKAGLIYNTFPLMGDGLIPRELLTQTPWWRDLLENPVSVQFLHRCFALTTTLLCGGLWVYQRHCHVPAPLEAAFQGMLITLLLQVFLGIITLLFQVPLVFALLHQGVAFLLFGSLVYMIFLLSRSEFKSFPSRSLRS